MFVVNDALDAILLGCFFFGLIFSGLSLFLGVADFSVGHDAGGHGGSASHHGGDHGGHDVVSPFSVGTILAFLTWFGGVAYLVRNGLELIAVLSIVTGLLAGVVGGYVIYWLLKKVRSQEAGLLRIGDTHMPGTLARVTSSIRAGGTGEIVYELHGVRQVSAARSATGAAIPRGTEVVVHQLHSGMALVEPWATYVGDHFDDLAPIVTAPPGERREHDEPQLGNVAHRQP